MRAGKKPKTTPTSTEKKKATATEYSRLTRIEGANDRNVVERIAGHALRGRCYFRQCGG